VPRKCNVLVIINNKNTSLAARKTRTRVIGAMIPQERGLKGTKSFYHILFTHNCFNGEKWLHEILGEGHAVLNCK
jgi:hypothetical protein